jgi:hypothetical protein
VQHWKTTMINKIGKILQVMKESILLLIIPGLILSCTTGQQERDQVQQSIYSLPFYSTTYTDSLIELTPEQQSAFDALNTLQVSTDEKSRLYSTFADICQPCYPPDTSFVISRAELLIAMKQFLTRHCTNLTIEKRNELAATSVLAQEEYTVLHCRISSNHNYVNGLPMSGTWIMPSVLGRRDVILEW